jgi:riboflavin kinase / FMN adenylyltransferase
VKLIRRIEDIKFDSNSVVTIGTFDGVHIAHQKIIDDIVERAKKQNGRSVVVTFDPHPREVVKRLSDLKLLTTMEERQELFEMSGVDCLVVIEFDQIFAKQTFKDFYVKYIIGFIGVNTVVEGYDHHWGMNREGNIDSLFKLGKEYGFAVVNAGSVTHNGSPVNSSLIRDELLKGRVEIAEELLGRPYSFSGTVGVGDKRGRLLGYPTANLELDSNKKIVPKDGIYFVRVELKSERFFGMASIGVRPTFQTTGRRTIEVNILNFNRDIYGDHVRISFLRRLRDEIKFDSAEQLVQQMNEDLEISNGLRLNYQNIL